MKKLISFIIAFFFIVPTFAFAQTSPNLQYTYTSTLRQLINLLMQEVAQLEQRLAALNATQSVSSSAITSSTVTQSTSTAGQSSGSITLGSTTSTSTGNQSSGNPAVAPTSAIPACPTAAISVGESGGDNSGTGQALISWTISDGSATSIPRFFEVLRIDGKDIYATDFDGTSLPYLQTWLADLSDGTHTVEIALGPPSCSGPMAVYDYSFLVDYAAPNYNVPAPAESTSSATSTQ